MVDIISPEYQGPERRKTIVVTDHCPCHRKHDTVIKLNRSAIETLETDMKGKVNWKLYVLSVVVVVGCIGGVWHQVWSGNRSADARMDAMDKRLVGVDTREAIFETNVNIGLGEIKQALKDLHDNLDDHMKEYRKVNGNPKTKGP